MTLEKELTKRTDERNNYYLGLSARMAYIGTAVTALIMTLWFALKGDLDKAFLVMEPVSIGVLLFFAFSIKWKIGGNK